jgi:hypothetical protein
VVVKAIAKCSANGKKCDKDTYRSAFQNTVLTDSGLVPEFGFTPSRHYAEIQGQLVHYDPASGGSKPATGFLKG